MSLIHKEGGVIMIATNKVHLSSVRTQINSAIKRLETTTLVENDFLRPGSVFNKPMYPTEILEQWDKLGIRRTLENYNDLMGQATELKRSGDLNGANQIYINIFRDQKKLDKEYIWPWCKIMILAKNFADLDLLLRFLYALNVREHITDATSRGERPTRSFGCNTALYLRNLCDSALASKDEVSWRFAQYGGSDYWKSYQLTDAQYRKFLTYFSLDKAGVSTQTPASQPARSTSSTKATAAATSTQQSGGCYIATAVYGSYDCPEVWTLRRYRDEHLALSRGGRAFITAYYAVSPWMVRHLGAVSPIRCIWKTILDHWIVRLHEHGYDDAPYSDAPMSKAE